MICAQHPGFETCVFCREFRGLTLDPEHGWVCWRHRDMLARLRQVDS